MTANAFLGSKLFSDPFQCLSVSQELLCAASSGSNVFVAKIENDINALFTIAPKSNSGNYPVTDVSWNNAQFGRLAVSSTNGAISVYDCETNVATKISNQPKSIWDSESKSSRSVHKVCWVDKDPSILLSGNQDGTIRLHDIRVKSLLPSITFSPRTEGIRDVHCNPFAEKKFAAISENGTVTVWDHRSSETFLMKFLAHTGSGLSINFHPEKENILASGGKDKYVKIWNLNDYEESSLSQASYQLSNSPSTPNHDSSIVAQISALNIEKAINIIPKPIISMRTPGPVNRVKWRGNGKTNAFDSCLATVASDRNEVFIWNLNYPQTPVCVLTGHSDTCTDFQWIDTPNSNLNLINLKQSRPGNKDGSSTSKNINHEYLNLMQHIFSIGKDGKMLLQDIRNGYFPRQHCFSHVVALSSTGNLAFHRGYIQKGDLLNVFYGETTSKAASLFIDQPNHFGMNFQSAIANPSNPSIFQLSLSQLSTYASSSGFHMASPKTSRVRKLGSSCNQLHHAVPITSSGNANYRLQGVYTVSHPTSPSHHSPSIRRSRNQEGVGSASSQLTSTVFTVSNHLRNSFSMYQQLKHSQHRAASHDLDDASISNTIPSASHLNSSNGIDLKLNTVVASGSSPAYAPTLLPSGIVYVGMTNIDSLETARLIRLEKYGAEGRKFDPAVMRLLAEAYIHSGKGKGLTPKETCEYNMKVAEKAGFLCRASIWNTVLTLLPQQEQLLQLSTATLPMSKPSSSSSLQTIAAALPSHSQQPAGASHTVAATTSIAPTVTDSPQASTGFTTLNTTSTPNPTPSNTHNIVPSINMPNYNDNELSSGQLSSSSVLSLYVSNSLPFSCDLIGSVLIDLLEVGDCQHFVILCEILLHASQSFLNRCLEKGNITKNRRIEAYYSYIELLHRFKQFTYANEIIIQTDIANIPALSQSGVLIHLSCSICNKELPENTNSPWCQKCKRFVGSCAICHEPVRGLYRWCAVCGHGGHMNCTSKWFCDNKKIKCPTGCGHECNALTQHDYN